MLSYQLDGDLLSSLSQLKNSLSQRVGFHSSAAMLSGPFPDCIRFNASITSVMLTSEIDHSLPLKPASTIPAVFSSQQSNSPMLIYIRDLIIRRNLRDAAASDEFFYPRRNRTAQFSITSNSFFFHFFKCIYL